MKQPSDRVDGNNNLRAAFRTPLLTKAHKAAIKAGVPEHMCSWAGGDEAWFTELWLQCSQISRGMIKPLDAVAELEMLEDACRIGLAELGIHDPELVPAFSHLARLQAAAKALRKSR